MSAELDRACSERDAAFAELRRLRAGNSEPYCPPLRIDPVLSEAKWCPRCGEGVPITVMQRAAARSIQNAWSALGLSGAGLAFVAQLCGCQGRMRAECSVDGCEALAVPGQTLCCDCQAEIVGVS